MIFDEEKELLWQEHCNYHSPETEKDRANNRWLRKSSLKHLGKETALRANASGYENLEQVKESFQTDLAKTLYKICPTPKELHRHNVKRLYHKLGLSLPKPKPQITCKCCKQLIEVNDEIDEALDFARQMWGVNQ